MIWRLLLIIGLGMIATGPIQDADDQALARLLATDSTRREAVASIRASKIPVLLSWIQHPPAGVNRYGLDIGLADAFGQLRTKEAIPFLIQNISLDRTRAVNTWLKAPGVIEERLPAVGALVKIGPEASKALIKACWRPMVAEDRLAAIFAITRIASKDKDVEARQFLSAALAQANMERYWAEEGLKLFDAVR